VNNGGTIQVGAALINNTGQTLTFGGATGTWILQNQSQIFGGTVNFSPATVFSGNRNGENALVDLTLGTDLTDSTDGSVLNISGLNGGGHTINMTGNGGSLVVSTFASPASTLTNVTVNLGWNTSNGTGGLLFCGGNDMAGTLDSLTIDSASAVKGWGTVGAGPLGASNLGLVNEGLISANVRGKTLLITPGSFTNDGTLQAISGGILEISTTGGPFAVGGVLSVDGSSTIRFPSPGRISFVTFDAQLGSNGNCGIFDVAGGLGLDFDVDLNLSLAPGAIFSTPYEIFSYTGSLSGTFAQVTPGFVLDYSQPGEILVSAVPEPSTCALVAAGALAALGRRRRKAPRI
jgi:hypothetical protein